MPTDTPASPAATEMAPCPFCGGDAEPLPMRLIAEGEKPPIFCVGCHSSAADADAWNRRATPDLAALRAERDVAQANVERLLTGLRLLAGGTFDADPPFVAVPAETLRKLAADLVAGKSVQDIAPALFRALAARAALAEARAVVVP